MIRLSKPQILLLHEQLLEATGGSSGLRDEGMLDSALNAPFQTFGGEDVYPSIQQKATRLCFGLVKNHPFVDGNKRIGAHAMLVFLALSKSSDFIASRSAFVIPFGFRFGRWLRPICSITRYTVLSLGIDTPSGCFRHSA